MSTARTVFRKELLDTVRDRRTLMFMVFIPLLLFPVMFRILSSVQSSTSREAESRVLRVAVVDDQRDDQLRQIIGEQERIEIAPLADREAAADLVREGQLDGVFVVADSFDESLAAYQPGRIDYYYRGTSEDWVVRSRLEKLIEVLDGSIMHARMRELGLGDDAFVGVDLVRHNVATPKEMIGSRFGGAVPYVIILFCFLGAMYPAIDLGAGEKERGTLETLLTTPVDRFGILVGKFGVIVLIGLFSALVSILGLYIGVRQSGHLQPEMFDSIMRLLGVETILVILSLLVPLTVFFAGLLLCASLLARSFKEAQSLMTPLNLAVLLPVAIALLPGVTLDWRTALIPVLNASLATKEIISGEIDGKDLGLVYTSLTAYALLAIGGTRWMFNRESIIFRG
jgi:sodium transport system permease protein